MRHEGIHGIPGPLGGRLEVTDDGLGGRQLVACNGLLAGLSLNKLDGFDRLGLFSSDDGVILAELGFNVGAAIHHDEAGDDQDEEPDPYRPIVFLQPKIRPFCAAIVNDYVFISHKKSPA